MTLEHKTVQDEAHDLVIVRAGPAGISVMRRSISIPKGTEPAAVERGDSGHA